MKKNIITLLFLAMCFSGLKAQDPYVGEIRMFAGNFEPAGWMFCDGRLLSIADYQVLFVLLGTTYGGDGQTTFALPDLRGRAPIHQGTGYVMGQMGGTETVTLTTNQIPAHTHTGVMTLGVNHQGGNADTPIGNVAAVNPGRSNEYSSTSNAAMGTVSLTATTSAVGGSQPHGNMKPYVVLNYIIAWIGIYPSQP